MRVDRPDALAVHAAQIARDMMLQSPLRPLGGDLRVPGVGSGPYHEAAICECGPLGESQGTSRTKP